MNLTDHSHKGGEDQQRQWYWTSLWDQTWSHNDEDNDIETVHEMRQWQLANQNIKEKIWMNEPIFPLEVDGDKKVWFRWNSVS